MRWEAALATARQLKRRHKLTALALGYQYLNEGPATLCDREQALRRLISSISEGEEIPNEICCDLIAWASAMHISRKRSLRDLPPPWSKSESTPG
jgi:hypothetical protein